MQKGKVYVHGDSWWFQYKTPFWDATGKKKWTSKYKKLAPADQFTSEAAIRKAGLVPSIPDTANATVGQTQLFNDYVEQVYFVKSLPLLKASTQRSYKQVYSCYVKPNVNGFRMCDFTLPFATQFMNKIAAEEREEPLSKSSYEKIKWFGVSVFKQAKIDGSFDWKLPNPFSEVPIPKNGSAKKQGRHAMLDDVFKMLDACDSVDKATAKKLRFPLAMAKTAMRVIATAAFSGLRKSEIQGLRWEDLKEGAIQVQRIAWRPTVVEKTKTPASADSVPLLPILAEHLEAHRNGFPPEGYIFVGSKLGHPLDLHNLSNRVIRPILKNAGIPWCGWHGFRRGLATSLHTLKVPDVDVQHILRHANVEVTQASYIKVPDAAKKAAMARLQKVLGTSAAAARRKR